MAQAALLSVVEPAVSLAMARFPFLQVPGAEGLRQDLVHALHAPDPEGTVDEIKTRYEARLKEIFR